MIKSLAPTFRLLGLTLTLGALLFNGPLLLTPVVSGSLGSGELLAAEEAKKPQRKSRRTPAMREKVYQRLAKAQKLADDGKVSEGLEILDALKKTQKRMNSYEKAMMWNFYGFIHYNKEDYKAAIKSFNQVVAQKNIPESLELSTLYSLAQIAMQVERYDDAIAYLNKWSKLNGAKMPAKTQVLVANAYYAKKDFKKANKAMTAAIKEVEAKGNVPKENWFVLQRAILFELKQPKAVTKVSEKLVRHYSKGKYWIELANMYGEVGEEKKQMAVMEAAYQQGFIDKGSDLSNLAQLYYINGAPYKSAKLMSKALSEGKLESNLKRLQFLAQAWSSAREYDKAIPVLMKAAKMANDGNVHARLAEMYVNEEKWTDAVSIGKAALEKGGLKYKGNLHIAIGMAYFYQEQYSNALEHFKKAKTIKRNEKVAQQWVSYTEREIKKRARLISTR